MSYAELCSQLDTLYASGNRVQLFDLVRRLALRRLRDEDAAQDVTCEAWRRIGSYNPKRVPFHAWVNMLCSDQRRQLYRAAALQAQGEECADLVCADDINPPRPAKVPVFPSEKAAQVFHLKADGYDLHEIAPMVGLTYGSLRVMCSRWIKEMRRLG